MSEISLEGLDSLGTEKVASPDPERAARVKVEPLADYKARQEAADPIPDRRRKLSLAQADREALPPPQEMVKIKQEADRQGLPFLTAAAAPQSLGPTQKSDLPWMDVAENGPVSDLLLDPEKSAFTSPEDIRRFNDLHGVLKGLQTDPLPETQFGVGTEQSDLARLTARRLLTSDGVLSPETETRIQELKARAKRYPTPQSTLGEVGAAVAQNAPDMARMAAIGLIGSAATTPAGGLTMVALDNFVRSAGDVQLQMEEAGVPFKVSRWLAPLGGAIIAGLDTASAGVLFKIPGLSALKTKALTSKTFRLALMRAMKDSWFRTLVKDMAFEGGTEGMQEVVAILDLHAAALASDVPVETPTFKEARDRVALNAFMGTAVGGVYGGAGTVTKRLLVGASHGTAAEQTINRIYGITENVPMRDLAPEVTHEVVDAISKDTGVEKVTLPAEKLVQLYQKAAEKDASVKMPESVQAALTEAQNTGGKVVLSLADFVTHVRPLDGTMTLGQDIGLNDKPSAADAKALRPAIEKAMKEIAALGAQTAENQDDLAPIIEDVKKKRIALGVTPDAAANEALLIASGVAAVARKIGQSPNAVYQDAMLFTSGRADGLSFITERLLGLSPEQRAREYFIDSNTGLKNAKALDLRAREGGVYYFADTQGRAYLNDKGGTYEIADALYRGHAQNLYALDPEVTRAYGGFVGWAPDEATARSIVERANAKAPLKGFTLEMAVGSSPKAAKEALDAWVEEQKKAGTRADRGTRPLGAEDVDPATLKVTAEPLRLELTEEERAHHKAFSAAEAHRVYVNPVTRVLTNRGWAVTRTENRKRYVLSTDVAGVGALDKFYGKAVADQIMAQVEHIAGALKGEDFDVAHPHGDEIVGQSNKVKGMREYAEKLRKALLDTTFKAIDPETNTEYTIQGMVLSVGVGLTERAADGELNADKERLAKAGLRDRKGEDPVKLAARITSRQIDPGERGAVGDPGVRGGGVAPGVDRGGAGGGDAGGAPAGAGGREAVAYAKAALDTFNKATKAAKAAPAPAAAPAAPPAVGPVEALVLDTLAADFTRQYEASRGATGLEQGGETRRGAITFDPTTRSWFRMTFTGKADLSTFLHESGHYFLELMRKYESNPDIAADLEILEEWAGVEPGGEWTVDALEKFARGFETYLGEGRAPSSRLAAAFSTFKAWIYHVYKTLTRLGTPLTDEVRGVMDRMLATNDEIDARRLELGYFPSDKLDMESEWVARYRATWTAAAAAAQARLDREAIRGFKKELSADFKKAKSDAAEQAKTHPVIALRSFLEGNDRTDGGPKFVPPHGEVKLDAEKVGAMTLPAGVKQAVAPYLVAANGLDPAELAPWFGFKNASEMLIALKETPTETVLARELAKAKMTEKHPDYGMRPDWVEQAALAALHEEDLVSNAIELELAAAHMKLGAPPPQSAAMIARAAAQDFVYNLKLKDVKGPAFYQNAEAAAHTAAMKAFAAKDFQAAAEATRQRLYSRAAWQAITKAMEVKKATEARMKRLKNFSTVSRLGRSSDMPMPSGREAGPQFRDALLHMSEALGFTTRSGASDQHLSFYVNDLFDGGYPVMVDPRLLTGPLPKWEDLTVGEMLAVKDAYDNITHVASEADSIRAFGEKVRINDIADAAEKDFADAGLLNRLGPEGEKPSWWRKLRLQAAKPETILIDAAGGVIGTLHKFLLQTAEKGQFEQDRRRVMRGQDLKALEKAHRPEGWAKRMKQKHAFVDGREYTGSEVFAMLLYMGTESSRTKLIEGMLRGGREGWSVESVTAFIHQVFPDAEPYKFAQATWDYLSTPSLWEDSAKVKEILTGVRPRKETALAFPLPGGGEVAGGYMPLVYDQNSIVSDESPQTAEALAAMKASNPLNAFAANGFTRDRTGYVAPLLLDPKVIAAHLYEVDHFISHAEGIVERHRVLNHPRIKAAIIRSLGREAWDQLHESNNYIARDGQVLTAELLQLTSVVDRLVFHNALLTMGGNFLSGLNQIVNGLPATFARFAASKEVNGLAAPAEFARVLAQFATNPVRMWTEVNEASGEVRDMVFHFDRDLRLILGNIYDGDTWASLRSKVASMSMHPVVFGQKIVNVITWKMAANLAIKAGMGPEQTVAYANMMVRQSQSTSSPKDFTALQRNPDKLVRVLTSLASYTFTLNDIVMPRRLTKGEVVDATTRLIVLLTTATMAKLLFNAMFPTLADKDEERESGLEQEVRKATGSVGAAGFQAALDVASNVPVVGRIATSWALGRQPRFTGITDTLGNATFAFKDLIGKGELSKRQVKSLVDSAGLARGLPLRHVFFAPAEFMHEYTSGNVEDAPWAFVQEMTLARPGQKGTRQ